MIKEKVFYFKIFIFLLIVFFSYVIANTSLQNGVLIVFSPLLFLVFFLNFKNHYFTLYLLVVTSFLIFFLTRLEPGITFGLIIDFLLLYLFVSLILNKNVKWDSRLLINPLVFSLLFWFFISLVALINPLATSKIAWFYANRAFSIHPLLIVLLTLHFFKKKNHLENFLMLWAFISVIGSLWGIKQLFFGLTGIEQAWLNAGAAKTHVLFGKLRVFSFYSDAAQFGVSQGYSALVFGLISIKQKRITKRVIYTFVALLSLYGMIISGTRGVISIVFVGFFVYLILSRDLKVVFFGSILILMSLFFLKFTTIGQSNYQINRMRTALNFDDPSFMIRINRIDQLKDFMSNKPFGYGIGTSGRWAQRFYPDGPQILKFTDGYYTSIWMQIGTIGLVLKLFLIAVIIIYFFWLIFKIEDPYYRQIAIAFLSGYCGFVVADFTNNLSSQLPSSVLLPISFGLIYLLGKNKIA